MYTQDQDESRHKKNLRPDFKETFFETTLIVYHLIQVAPLAVQGGQPNNQQNKLPRRTAPCWGC